MFDNANRSSGDWLPNVDLCHNTVQPCGNTACTDEAMRGAAIAASSPHGAAHAIENAGDIAANCQARDVPCPLAEYTGAATPTQAIEQFVQWYEP